MRSLPVLASNLGVNISDPVVVQSWWGFSAVVPSHALVSTLSSPTHRTALATALATRSRIEPLLEESAIPGAVKPGGVRRKHSLETVEKRDSLRGHLRRNVVAAKILNMHDV